MDRTEVYVAFGGNIGDTDVIFRRVLKKLASLSFIEQLESSSFFRTSPVGPPQDPYLNAVCRFQTTLSPIELHRFLQNIEQEEGRSEIHIPNGPREIDLDLLFYGKESVQEGILTIPHPRWKERLFVLAPLMELTKEVWEEGKMIDLAAYMKTFSNPHNETVKRVESLK